MKNFAIILFSLVLCVSYAQKEKKANIKLRDGIFNANFIVNKKISISWSVGSGLNVRYNFDVNSFELPIHFKYKVNQKLDVFAGPSFYSTTNINRYGNLLNAAGGGVSGQVGVQYNFSENAFAKMYYQRNFNAAENANLGINNVYNGLNFKLGYKF